MKKKVVIVLAALIVVGGVIVGSIAMNGNSDKKHINKKTKIVLETDQENKDSKDNEDNQEQTEESNTEESNVSEEQKEESVATSSSEEKKETKEESKKEEKEKSKKTEEKKSTKEEKKTFSTEASKPSSKPAPSKPVPSKPAPSKPAPSKPEPSKPNKPNKPSHTHNWVATTKQVHHPAVGHNEKVLVKAAWTEKIPRYTQVAREICNNCGADITKNYREHEKNHMLNGEKGGRHTEYKKVFSHYEEVYHEAQYTTKWVIDKAAWTETVITGYHCSCGAKK